MHISPILLWNATSIKNKVHELTFFPEKFSIPPAILTETWLKPIDSLSIPNYTSIRKDRPIDQGGGVATLIHNNIHWQSLYQPNLDLEYVSVKVLTPSPLIIVPVYIPPQNPIDHKTVHKLTTIDSNRQFLIGSDFNARYVPWNNKRNNLNGKTIQKFIGKYPVNIIYSSSFTFLRGKCASAIDIFLTYIIVSTKCNTENDLSSSHKPVILEIDSANHISLLTSYHTTYWNIYK